MRFKNGDRVLVHSFGPMYEGKEFPATICGIAMDYITQIYIVKLDHPEDLNWPWDCCQAPDGCLKPLSESSVCLSPPRGLGCAPHDGKAVHMHSDGKWWFWDETWCNEYGPYKDEEEANFQILQYVKECL